MLEGSHGLKRVIERRSRRYLCTYVMFFLVAIFGIQAADAQNGSDIYNVIYVIGDGMSFKQMDVGRLAKESPLQMDYMPIQNAVGTSSASSQVTDSAAGATAHATGTKTNNNMVSMLRNGTRLVTVLEMAKEAGFRTAIVTNDAIHGATPAAYTSHVWSRHDTRGIMLQSIFETQPDILLGGGHAAFDDLELGERLHETDYVLVRTYKELLNWNLTTRSKLLGLFTPNSFPFAADRSDFHISLADMVKVALDILASSDECFFIMIEDDRIDGAGHNNDLRRLAHQMVAFDEMLQIVREFVADRDDTLLVVSADHETGGLTSGSSNLSDEIVTGRLTEHAYYFTTEGHTGVDVPLYAEGPGSDRFKQLKHISEAGQEIIRILGFEREE